MRSNSNRTYLLIALALLVFGVASRFMPHPPNIAPIAALALFGGAILPRGYGLWLPLGAIVISDLFIGLHGTIFWTWGSFALIALGSSTWLRGRIGTLSLFGASLSASLLFYLITNFGVWISGGLYPNSLSGLMSSYINGIPFLRNTLVGDLAYSAAVFGAYFAVAAFIRHKSALKTVHSSSVELKS